MDNCCMSVLLETQLRSDVGQCTIRCLDISSKYSYHKKCIYFLYDYVVGLEVIAGMIRPTYSLYNEA